MLRFPPDLRDGGVDVCLVDDFGNQLGPGVDERAARRGQLCLGDGIFGTVGDEEGEESEARSSPTARTRLMMECRRGWDADLRVSCALMSCDIRVAVFVSSSNGTGTYAAIGNWDVSVSD